MTDFGYSMMCEHAGPEQLVHDVQAAERAGFDFAVISDHYFPWLDSQGHSPYAWSVLGAAAYATSSIELMTYVTCPLFRYHPAVVAQKAATVQLLAGGRFTLGLGAGENLNEHVVQAGWPPVDIRHDMLTEAIQIIRRLWTGEYLNFAGDHYDVFSAKLWDIPETLPPIGVAVSGTQSCRLAGALGDVMIATDPDPGLVARFEDAGGRGKPKIGQIAVSYDPDEKAAVKRALEQFRWSVGSWKVNAELPGPSAFEAATQYVREEDIARLIPCGPDLDRHVKAVESYIHAGFTHVALLQVGGAHQGAFLEWAERELLPALRRL